MLILSLLIYFISFDLTFGGLILAANARWRWTPDHRELRRRMFTALPWTAASWVLAAAALLALLMPGDSAIGATMILPQRAGRDFVPRSLHLLFAAPAVAGFAVAYSSLAIRRSDPLFAQWLARHGLVWFVLCSALNLPVGGAWLVKLPRFVLERLEGGDTGAMAAISIAVIAAIFALGFGALASVLAAPRGYVHATAVSLVITLIAMVIVREQLRPVDVPLSAARSVVAALLTAGALGCLWRAWSSFVARRPTV